MKQRAQGDATRDTRIESAIAPFVQLHQTMPSDVEAISPFVDHLMRFILRFRGADGTEHEIELALREAITNAVVHGNHSDPCKVMWVTCRCGLNGALSIEIGDQGSGFDSHALSDPTAPENLLAEHGRGIYLMKRCMDEVSFEEHGTVVHMYKRANRREQSRHAAKSFPPQTLPHHSA